jgi:cyanophycin synthetase
VADGAISVVIDLAHNEAGLEALLEIMNGIRPPGGRLLLGVGTAGDRTDDVFVKLGQIAAIGADVVEIAHKQDYLRGRTTAELGALIKAGAADAGMQIEREHQGETECLASLVARAAAGDVVAVMTHQDRDEVNAWLREHRGSRDDAPALRAKVVLASSARP